MARGFGQSTPLKDKVKEDVAVEQVLTYFGYELDSTSMVCCPFHEDNTPSMIANDGLAYCFACDKGWDVIDLAADLLNLSEGPRIGFYETVDWLYAHKDVICKSRPTLFRSRPKKEYQGALDPFIAYEWHSALTDTDYDHLWTERGLTRETVDYNVLGYREDWQADTIPLWEGEPGNSEIETVLFRRSDASPTWFRSKYIGLPGYHCPSFVGRHSLQGFNWCVILFGVYDALLAVQDGLPALSPNTLTAWKDVFVNRLNDTFMSVDVIYAVRDNTPSEWQAEDKFLSRINKPVIIREFPEGKDYGEYRRKKSVDDFFREVLRMGFV